MTHGPTGTYEGYEFVFVCAAGTSRGPIRFQEKEIRKREGPVLLSLLRPLTVRDSGVTVHGSLLSCRRGALGEGDEESCSGWREDRREMGCGRVPVPKPEKEAVGPEVLLEENP